MNPSTAPQAAPCAEIGHAVVLITGIQAAGKSTVAQALAERLPRSVHVRGDDNARPGSAQQRAGSWGEAERVGRAAQPL
jgi:adenylylsulfate kinase-like enzyme